MNKTTINGIVMSRKILSGMEKLANPVMSTLGPAGKNVIIDRPDGTPLITNDGVTIAKEINVRWKFENMGAKLLKESALKTNEIAGDGTTTATTLGFYLTKIWIEEIADKNVNVMQVKAGMKEATEFVLYDLEEQKKFISWSDEICKVATLSAQDEEVGCLIADAFSKVGNNGIVTVEEWQKFWLELHVTKGFEFNTGYISPYMVTDKDKMTAELQDPLILVTNHTISSIQDLVPLLETLIKENRRDVVIISEDVEMDPLNTMIINKVQGIFNIVAIKAPEFGETKVATLQDIAILVWAKYIDSTIDKLTNVTIQDLWTAKKVIAGKNKTTIVEWGGSEEAKKERIEKLEKDALYLDGYYKEKAHERLARLDGWVAVIKVWAPSETEMNERRLRIEDALNATRSAIEEWVVQWGWIALFLASEQLYDMDFWSEDKNIGAKIVREAIKLPMHIILTNANCWADKLPNVGLSYNILTKEHENFMETWILDPKKVTRVALEQSVSLASTILTADYAITDDEEETA